MHARTVAELAPPCVALLYGKNGSGVTTEPAKVIVNICLSVYVSMPCHDVHQLPSMDQASQS